MKLHIVAIGLVLTACSSQPRAPYVAPDSPAGKIASIAFMPYYGQSVEPSVQSAHATLWAEWWNDVYPGIKWALPSDVSAQLLAGDGLDAWSAQEKSFIQTGQFSPAALTRLCAITKTAGILQGTLFAAQPGSGNRWWFLKPVWAADGAPGTARMTLALFSCNGLSQVWSAHADLKYSGDYTVGKMVEYALGTMAGKISP